MISFEMFKDGKVVKNDVANYPPNLKMFPEPTEVFSEKQSWLNDRFKPLFSFDIGEVNPDWAGQILHCVAPLYSNDGGLKYDPENKRHDYIGDDWYVFKVDDDNKYELLADESLFADNDINPNFDDYLLGDKYIDEYVGNLIGYQKSKAYYNQYKKLARFSTHDKFTTPTEVDEVLTLGGHAGSDISYYGSDPNYVGAYDAEWYSIVYVNDNDCEQVALVDMVKWFPSCGAYLYMFFEPKNKMVVIKLSFD